ncbi:MAG: ABC transporter permease, partial [Planctomycetes bacterium]|nr:ABC transporter permease [Planctomycetota bacterium]
MGQFSYFGCRAFWAALGAVRRPRETLIQLFHIHVGALPLATATGLALGVVLWLHLHGVLARFGPNNMSLLPRAVALAVVLEMAPTGAGFIVAGRSGAGLGAELGSMRLTE